MMTFFPAPKPLKTENRKKQEKFAEISLRFCLRFVFESDLVVVLG